MLLLAAFLLQPLTFLAAVLALALIVAAGLTKAISSAWRARADIKRTAWVADQRVDFKARLTTLVTLARGGHSALWPYLLEETLMQQEEFDPSRVERLRVSRSLYGLLASAMLAGLAALLVFAPAKLGMAAKAGASRTLEATPEQLQLKPADDPALGTEAEVSGDPAALDKLARQQSRAAGARVKASKLLDKARDLASALQNKLTGRKPERPRIKLHLAQEPKEPSNPDEEQNHPGAQTKPGPLANNGNESTEPPMTPPGPRGRMADPGQETSPSQRPAPRGDALASNKPMVVPGQSEPGGEPGGSSPKQGPGSGSAREGNGGGASHGSGSDPEHLFGPPQRPTMGKDSFGITLEARLAPNGPTGGERGYVPPKVRATINAQQQPDEPLGRSEVPAEDRQTVKRVFER